MDISIKNQQGLDATLSVKIDAADYHEDLEKALQDYRKRMNVPGFRPGKVPMGMVRRMVEKDVKRDLVEKFLQKNIQEYITNNQVKLILSPLAAYKPEELDWQQEQLEFDYNIGMRPELKLDLEALNHLSRYVVEPSDEDVNKEIEQLRQQAGKVEGVEEVTNDPELTVLLHFHELDETGNELEGGIHKTITYKYDELPIPLKHLVDGQKKGFTATVNITEIYSTDELAEKFGVDQHTAQDLNENFKVEIRHIYKVNVPEMDQEFFDRYFEPGTVTNEEEFRKEWRKLVENYFARQASNVLATDVKDALVDETRFEFPEDYLRRYLLRYYNAASESEVEDFEKKLEEFRNELKWMLIADKVAEEQKIEVTEEDAIHYTIDSFRNEFAKAGLPGIDEETLRKYAINYLGKENNFDKTFLALRDGKVFEYLLAQIHPKEKKVSVQAFEEIAKPQ